MSKLDWNYNEIKANATEEVGFDTIEVKPYIVKILDVKDVEEKQYLKVSFDIAEGDLKDYFKEQYKKFGGDWPSQGTTYRSYKDSAKYFFASFITAVEKSNDNFKFNPNDDWAKQLEGKLFVANFGEEEYVSEGDIKVSVKCREIRSTQALKDGKIKNLELKEYKGEAVVKDKDTNKDGLPF